MTDDLEPAAQPRCPECGTVMVDDGPAVVCRGCGTVAVQG